MATMMPEPTDRQDPAPTVTREWGVRFDNGDVFSTQSERAAVDIANPALGQQPVTREVTRFAPICTDWESVESDDEEFCEVCFAGLTSSEHHEKCLAPLDQVIHAPYSDPSGPLPFAAPMPPSRPCEGRGVNVCVAEGCYAEACIATRPGGCA